MVVDNGEDQPSAGEILWAFWEIKKNNPGYFRVFPNFNVHVQIFSVSLFWTGAVFCNVVHVIVSGLVMLLLIHGGKESPSMPAKPLLRSFKHSVTTSLGSICYGSLFTAAIRTLRWGVCNSFTF